MGTSSSSSGPKGQTPLLPSWATGNGNKPSQDQGQNSDSDSKNINQNYNLTSVKGSLTRIVNNTKGATFKNAGKSYVRRTGGHRSATLSSKMGVATGSNYFGFFTSAAKGRISTNFGEI